VTDFAEIDALAADFYRRGGQPALAYGIVQDGELVHAGGLGECQAGAGTPPDQDTVFRIASMTKSFTAAAVLLLRDEGALALDDLAEEFVPELRGWPLVTPGAARVSIRHLLTMTAGLPTDDPWGDRQQGLPLDEFAKFLAGGVTFAWAPGTRFEYSNLGYALLGRVITAASKTPYPEFVRDRLLRPLGMTRSGYEAADAAGADAAGADPARAGNGLALGYRRAPAGWEEVPLEPYGAFAPMGGLFTCVRDLSRWVAGLASVYQPGPGSSGPGAGAHPLRPASCREMQLPQVPTSWDSPATFPPDGAVTAYGFGLAITDDPATGRDVGHGGGYPGFGSFMRWKPATGTGVIAFGNSTYARMQPLTAKLLHALTQRKAAPRTALAPARQPWPETLAARDAVTQLLASWDDDAANRLFSPNVAQDIPYAERRHAIALVRDRTGGLRDAGRVPEHDSPAHCRWWLAGEPAARDEDVAVQVQILLTPERPPRVQSLTLAVPPAPGSQLYRAVSEIIAWMNGTGAPPRADATVQRRLKAAAAWAGQCRPAAYAAGDGSTSVSVDLAGVHATLTLSVAIEPATNHLRHVDITWRPANS
jgi:CubicO group peptidase (beta-lactamase class C family)